MLARHAAIATLVFFGLMGPCAAADLAIGNYHLGMSLEDFRSQAVNMDTTQHVTRTLCSYEREMQDHMVGVLGYQMRTSQKAGVLVCIFAEPDRKTGIRSGWWEETTVPFAGHDVKWRFWFSTAPNQPGRWELFALAGHGPEKAAGDPDAIAAMQSQLTQEIGAGKPFADDRHKGLIWDDGDRRAAFLVHHATDVLDDSSICFGIADLPTITAINQRLAPSSMRLAGLCSADPS